MKKFIIKLLLFLGLVFIADYAVGNLYYLYDYVKGGTLGKTHQVMTKIEPDILILGSSRASHHYNSEIISDRLGMKTYNAGFNGQGTLQAYGFLKGVMSRHTPKIILYELTPWFDIYIDAKSSSINILAPYSSQYELQNLFNDIDQTNRFKMLSKSYQYNSIVFRIIPNLFSDRSKFMNGYEPLSGMLKDTCNIKRQRSQQPLEIDSVKVKYFKRIIEDANISGSKLIFLISPSLRSHQDDYKDIVCIANENNIKVFNHLQDTIFVNHPELFQDGTHMNEIGANKYSEIIAKEIEDYLQTKK